MQDRLRFFIEDLLPCWETHGQLTESGVASVASVAIKIKPSASSQAPDTIKFLEWQTVENYIHHVFLKNVSRTFKNHHNLMIDNHQYWTMLDHVCWPPLTTAGAWMDLASSKSSPQRLKCFSFPPTEISDICRTFGPDFLSNFPTLWAHILDPWPTGPSDTWLWSLTICQPKRYSLRYPGGGQCTPFYRYKTAALNPRHAKSVRMK
jgi:hypothetical protein